MHVDQTYITLTWSEHQGWVTLSARSLKNHWKRRFLGHMILTPQYVSLKHPSGLNASMASSGQESMHRS